MDEFLYGIHPVREGLRARRRQPLELFLAGGAPERLAELEALARQAGIPVRHRERHDLARLAGTPHHQGAVLRVTPFPYADLEQALAHWRESGEAALFLVLDGVTDPHNFGALLRSADAAGCHAVIVPRDRFASVTGVVEKASAGALEHLLLCQVTNLARTLEELKTHNVWVYGLAGEPGAASLYATDLTGPVALVAGSEGEGLRPNVRKQCDGLLAIPLHGGVESLNVSVATGIALFEAVRQRGC